MRRTFRLCAAVVVAALTATFAAAQVTPPHVMKGTVLKYSQPIGHLTPLGNDMHSWGEDIPSDVDWNNVMQSPTIPPNWVIADDFRDPFNTPVMTVRWWGSYTGPTFQQIPGGAQPLFGPGSEDGYVISFFTDIPADPANGMPSRPGELLGTYILPLERVWIEPTPFIGWPDTSFPPDDPRLRIWEYKANLMDAHLDHAVAGISDQMGFHQKAGEVYWISIMAEVGHRLIEVPNPDGTPDWEFVDTGKFAEPNQQHPEGHFWGWHTSPIRFNDVASMGHLAMPEMRWEYLGWMPIEPRHELLDMAFELYTIPEPSSIVLIGFAAMGICCFRSRFAKR